MSRRFSAITTAVTTAVTTMLGVALLTAAPSSAATPSDRPASAGQPSRALPLLYVQKTSALQTIDANSSFDPFQNCPGGYKAVGGGAHLLGNNLDEFLSLTEPSASVSAWVVNLINNSSSSGTYHVYAQCLKNIPGYTEAFGQELQNPSGTQTVTTANCPAGTVPYGGGGLATSASNEVSINSSVPTATGWRTDVNNNSGSNDFAQTFALCGTQPAGYQLVSGNTRTISPGTQALARVTCPSGTSVLSGGGFSSSGSVVVQLNSTLPNSSTGWTVHENNNTGSSNSITASAICATVG